MVVWIAAGVMLALAVAWVIENHRIDVLTRKLKYVMEGDNKNA